MPLYENVDIFLKEVLKRNVIIPSDILYNTLTDKQKQIFDTHFHTQNDETIMSPNDFLNESHIQSILLYHSLWIGAGYKPEEYPSDI